ncbi:MAG TPA: formate dehydrogenase-N subunit alpha [Candidatus Hydrogenedentes bacterium]|nr:formate dehydrogenase-N subunit alpha [Candidatus Hydrogenedentota bacterium]HRT21231.1 formate dehydrogenase-N subunit alpha [Candidatus Hydrogenedentota bacterium]HRT66481.1 formate dehydrogenase-N subunit alpha [Candidatus Hydrogenedentota bacterium]
MSEVSRRQFLVGSGGLLGFLGIDLSPALSFAESRTARITRGRQTTTICPYCGCGCSAVVSSEQRDGRWVAINVEGDADHPINEGTLCAKGASLYQMCNNENRLKKVLHRKPGSDRFEEVDWATAAQRIARLIKDTRDASFTERNAKDQVVNRTTAIASLGSAALDNEECWLYQKFVRGLGLVYIEHQARLCHSSTVPSLAATYGRGAMTNHWIDLKNSDVILAMGSNPGANHPISMHWVMKAKENGAKLVCVDPRFTRTACVADVYAPLRSGTDIAFLGGMIKYILDKDLIQRDYVLNYTNASFIVSDDYSFDEASGLFNAYDPEKRKYDKSKWTYKLAEGTPTEPQRDMTLQDPRCVYQLLKKHYARYDMETVSKVTGTPVADLERVYETYASTHRPDRAGTIMYAMGWTQHTVGVQNIRAMAVIQLLLGNIGVAGGGVNAMRGESNVQGSTDHGLLFHILPGYLKTPAASLPALENYNKTNTPATLGASSVNWWGNTPKYMTSFLKSMFGDNATPENDFGYAWLPKVDDGVNYSWLQIFDKIHEGEIRGMFAWGMNPACSGANSNKTRQALAKLDWLVNVNIFPNETGWFWEDASLGIPPSNIKTEVFVLPAAASIEKQGSITNSGRWMQWRYKGADAPGDARPDGDIMNLIFAELRKLYASEGGQCPEPILNLRWDEYLHDGEIDAEAIAKDINGQFLADVTLADGKSYKKGELVPSFAMLQADGTTSSGCWIYAGSFTQDGQNKSKKRVRETSGIGLHPDWAWSWPVNRRILYNRASVDVNGVPYNPRVPVIAWDADAGKWTGDVVDAPATIPPMAQAGGKLPFIMNEEGVGRLWTMKLEDGPFPEHYEPFESPIDNNPFNGQPFNPACKVFKGPMDKRAEPGGAEFPIVASTYRLTEHWQTGVMTRNCPWLLELQPQMFVEMSETLAEEKGIRAGDVVEVKSARGTVLAVAIPTKRFKPMTIMGKTVHTVGMPWCFGWKTPNSGDSANLLTPNIGDANTMIPETKTFLVNIEKAHGKTLRTVPELSATRRA